MLRDPHEAFDAVQQAAFCLALLLISCIGASLLQTAGGRVAVSTIRVPVGDGEWISAQLYKPVSASAQAAVPYTPSK